MSFQAHTTSISCMEHKQNFVISELHSSIKWKWIGTSCCQASNEYKKHYKSGSYVCVRNRQSQKKKILLYRSIHFHF